MRISFTGNIRLDGGQYSVRRLNGSELPTENNKDAGITIDANKVAYATDRYGFDGVTMYMSNGDKVHAPAPFSIRHYYLAKQLPPDEILYTKSDGTMAIDKSDGLEDLKKELDIEDGKLYINRKIK